VEIHKEGWFVRGCTDSSDGNAKEPLARQKALEKAGLDFNNLVTCKQVHGGNIAEINDAGRKLWEGYDGLITSVTGVITGIFAADCAPVLIAEEKRKVLGNFHAGRRGVYGEIVKKGVAILNKNWNAEPANMKAFVGPHILECCYFVGSDVAELFPEECKRTFSGKISLSLQKAIVRQLLDAGLSQNNIFENKKCTCCGSGFYSYRRDKTEKRMLSFAVII